LKFFFFSEGFKTFSFGEWDCKTAGDLEALTDPDEADTFGGGGRCAGSLWVRTKEIVHIGEREREKRDAKKKKIK
jgi:hypothetical protein